MTTSRAAFPATECAGYGPAPFQGAGLGKHLEPRRPDLSGICPEGSGERWPLHAVLSGSVLTTIEQPGGGGLKAAFALFPVVGAEHNLLAEAAFAPDGLVTGGSAAKMRYPTWVS